MFEPSLAKLALILPFVIAVAFLLWFLWNLNKQSKR
jgi:hypothetical protein